MRDKNNLTGKIIGDYRIHSVHSELDTHSSHRTFLGRCLSPTASLVIIKLLSTASHSPQEQQNILQEISTVQELTHPGILPILSAGIYNDKIYIITPYVAAGSLHHRLKTLPEEQPLPQEEALAILAQLGQVLQYAHEQHVVHGNIKPENVLFNSQDQVLLTDFHLPSFLPPDQAGQTTPSEVSVPGATGLLSNQTSEADDQYALGCLAYEMFTGHKPFLIPSASRPEKYYKMRSLITPGHLNPLLPPHIDEAILKALSKEPAQRYSDIPAFLTALGIFSTPEDGDQEKEEKVLVQTVIADEDLPRDPNLLTDSDSDPLSVVEPAIGPVETTPMTESAINTAETVPMAFPLMTIPPENPSFPPSASYASEAWEHSVEPIERDAWLSSGKLPVKPLLKPSVQNAWKRQAVVLEQILIPMLCLVAVGIIVTALFLTSNFAHASLKVGITPPPYATSVAQIPTPTSVLSVSSSQPTQLPSTPTSSTPTGSTPTSSTPASSTPTSSTPTSAGTPMPSNFAPTPTPTPTPVPPGLVGYWKFDEGSDTTANDSSGHGFTGTLQPGASWATGNVGPYALNLNGANDSYVDIPGLVVNTANSFSVAAWVKLNAFNDYETFVSQDGNNLSAFYLQWVQSAGTFLFTQRASDAPATAIISAHGQIQPTLGVWYHLVGVYDANAQTISLYINGSLQQTVSDTSSWQGTGDLLIGAGKYITRKDFVNGEIDDVQIYDIALSAQKVADLFASS